MRLQEMIEELNETMGLFNADYCNQTLINPRQLTKIEDLI